MILHKTPRSPAPPAHEVVPLPTKPARSQPRARTTALLCTLLLGGCELAGQTSLPSNPTPLAVLADSQLTELSGIAASRAHPGLYYVLNDSGAPPVVYLIDRTGRTRATLKLKDAHNVDYEDIALAPGASAGKYDVCVADIGDNNAKRQHVTIYRFPEPILPAGDAATVEVEPVPYHCRYADGARNAEGFAVHPRTGAGYIFSKRQQGGSAVYKLPAPWPTAEPAVLSKLAELEIPPALLSLPRVVVAADISPDGTRLVVRCYVDGWEWRLPPDTPDTDFDRIFRETPSRLALPSEPQGEALCFSADGTTLLTISEGRSPTLYEVPHDPRGNPAR